MAMEVTDTLSFSHEVRKDIYEFIEREGEVREAEIRRALNLDPTAIGHHLTVLRRDGYVRRDGNKLRVAYQEADAETHTDDDLRYTIRTAIQRDLSGLVEVIREVARDGSYIEAESVADVLDHEEVILRHNQLQSRMVFVATVDDEVVGWVHLDVPEAEKLSHTAVLTVGIVPEYRGHGIGSALLERGARWAARHDFEKLYNSIPATNERAIEFLESHGWVHEATRENHYKIEGDYVDEVMMAVMLR